MLPTGQQTVPISAGTHVVYDGNSLMRAINSYVTALAPIASSGCTASAVAIAGQTWTDMRSTTTDVDTALANGDNKVLLLWETTNQLNGGAAVPVCWDQFLRYIDGRRALFPNVRIIVAETLPREGHNASYHTVEEYNVKLQAIDEMTWANSHRYDYEFLTLRVPGSPYRFTAFDTAAFDATQDFWNETAGTRVHCTPAGYAVLAPEFARALCRVKAFPSV